MPVFFQPSLGGRSTGNVSASVPAEEVGPITTLCYRWISAVVALAAVLAAIDYIHLNPVRRALCKRIGLALIECPLVSHRRRPCRSGVADDSWAIGRIPPRVIRGESFTLRNHAHADHRGTAPESTCALALSPLPTASDGRKNTLRQCHQFGRPALALPVGFIRSFGDRRKQRSLTPLFFALFFLCGNLA